MQTKLTLWTETVWWEPRRLVFNFVLLVSGLFLLFLVQRVKPIHSHLYFKGYFDLIVAYGLFANLAYTAVYIFVIRLINRFTELTNKIRDVREFTYRTIILVGLLINFFAAGLELAYRLTYIK